MPFDAMKGLTEALAERDERRSRVERRELDDAVKEKIGSRLARLSGGENVRLTFFSRGHYLTVEATVTECDAVYGYLKLGTERVYFDDIFAIEII
jgi:hypothetical protein